MEARVAEEMTEHIRELGRQHHVTVNWTRQSWQRAAAFPDPDAPAGWQRGSVIIPVIRRPSDYLVCLHELGHVIDENSLRFVLARNQYEEILCESAAWAWAAEQLPSRFQRHIKARDWDTAAYGWRTYLAGQAWRRKRPTLVPRAPV